MSSGKSGGQNRSEIEARAPAARPRGRRAPPTTPERPTLAPGDQGRGGGDVEALALVVDRRRRDAGFDQLDPAAVDHRVVGDAVTATAQPK